MEFSPSQISSRVISEAEAGFGDKNSRVRVIIIRFAIYFGFIGIILDLDLAWLSSWMLAFFDWNYK